MPMKEPLCNLLKIARRCFLLSYGKANGCLVAHAESPDFIDDYALVQVWITVRNRVGCVYY